MENERRNKLLATVKQFNKEQKSEVFTLGNEIETLDVIPSGISVLDSFIGGGFKQGGHTIVYGAFSVGKTAWILQTIANAQKLGKLCCYVNTEKPIEPERFKFFEIDLDSLLYIEAPENAETALEAMRRLCKEKVIDLFIIDSTNGLCPKSVQEEKEGKERGLDKKNVASLPLTLSNFYNVVNAQVFRSRAAVIWIGQTRTKGIGSYFAHDGLTGGNAQNFYSYQIIYMRRGQNSNAPMQKFKEYYIDPDGKTRYTTIQEPIGFSVVLKLDKTNSCKSSKEKTEIEVPFYYFSGFKPSTQSDEEVIRVSGTDEEKELITKMLIEKGILKSEVNSNEKIEELSITTVEIPSEIENKKKKGRPKKVDK